MLCPMWRLVGRESCLERLVEPFHHVIRLRVVRRRSNVLNAERGVESVHQLRFELSPLFRCDNVWHPEPRDPVRHENGSDGVCTHTVDGPCLRPTRETVDACKKIFRVVGRREGADQVEVNVPEPSFRSRERRERSRSKSMNLGPLTPFTSTRPFPDLPIHAWPDEACFDEPTSGRLAAVSLSVKGREYRASMFLWNEQSRPVVSHVEVDGAVFRLASFECQ